MSGTFEDFLAEEQNRTGGNYSDSVSISLEDLLAADTDNFDFGYDPYDTSPLDALFPDTPKKDDRNAFQRLLGAFGVGGSGGSGGSGGPGTLGGAAR